MRDGDRAVPERSLLAADELESATLRLALVALADDLDQRDLLAGLAALQEISRGTDQKTFKKLVPNGAERWQPMGPSSFPSAANRCPG